MFTLGVPKDVERDLFESSIPIRGGTTWYLHYYLFKEKSQYCECLYRYRYNQSKEDLVLCDSSRLKYLRPPRTASLACNHTTRLDGLNTIIQLEYLPGNTVASLVESASHATNLQ